MNRDQMKGKWKQLKGRAKERWGELTNDDLDEIDGRRERLIGKLQERYGESRERASEQVDDFLDQWDEGDRESATRY